MTDERRQPNAICLTETFVKKGMESNIFVKNYNLVSHFCRHEQRGGVCILLKTGEKYVNLQLVDNLSVSKKFECCGVELPEYNIILICLYRIPNSDPKFFLDTFEVLLYKLTFKNRKRIIIAGDTNINILKNNQITKQYLDLIKNYNLTMHIKEPTRGHSCIDHIISNIKESQSNLLYLGLSDHETAQMLQIPIVSKTNQPRYLFIYRRDISRENIQKFKWS